VGIDLTGMSTIASGVRTRAEGMIRSLAARPDELRLHLLTDDPWGAGLGSELGLCVQRSRSSRFARLVSTRRRVRSFIAEHQLDAVQLEAPPVPVRPGAPLLFSLHDIRYLDQPLHEERSIFGLYQRFGLGRWARRSDCVLALTETMRLRFIDELHAEPNRVLTVPPGLPPFTACRSGGGATEVSPEPFVLCLGHLEARKNLAVVVAAAGDGAWPEGVALIIAGRDEGEGDRLRMMASRLPDERCQFVGAVSDDVRDDLLRTALVVAIPSTIEGFGMVALEATAAGAPILAARASALPEVVGTDATLLEAEDPRAWADAVAKMVTDPCWREEILSSQRTWMARFSWDRSAELLVGAYRAAVAEDAQ
jgi:glycosyltransferase involved in cell wall biosynthesis